MRGGTIGVLAAALGAFVAAAPAVATSRAQCLAACAPTIAQCGTTCGVFADLDASCRRAILKRCRREGIGSCATSVTSATTTTKPSTTSLHPTTTAHPSTTTTTAMPTGQSCAAPRPLAIGGVEAGDTGNGVDHGPGVGCMQNAEAPDLVYALVPANDGTLVLSLTSAWDGGLYVRTTCDDPATELVCTDQLGTDATEVLQLQVTGGVTYYVFVDGYTTDSYGAYELTSELQ